ncbi:hypothetical protein J2S93_004891, partial [Arthrobacter bambusae]|nr:hypothetical protein [Arthrobacter bambusae]
DVNGLRQRVRSGLDDGDFALLYLWVSFWANGGCASSADMDSFIYGFKELPDYDALVLGAVVEELRHT